MLSKVSSSMESKKLRQNSTHKLKSQALLDPAGAEGLLPGDYYEFS